MAKLGSFFRRLFSPSADMTSPTSSLTVESSPISLVFPSSSASKVMICKPIEIISQSSNVSSRSTPTHPMIKQITVNINGNGESSSTNFLSSHTNKTNDRRLSAPMIIHTSITSHQQFHSTVVNESTEEALISSLQRFSLSTPTTTTTPTSTIITPTTIQSPHSLGPSRSGSISTSLPRPDVRSASFHLSPSSSNSLILPTSLSNTLLNNISSVSGR